MNSLRTTIAALGLVTGLLVGLTLTATAQGEARHRVSMKWEVTYSDLYPHRADVIDGFISSGRPFRHARVQTHTPREQSSDPIRTPEFEGKHRRGRFRGHLRVEKTYLETTATQSRRLLSCAGDRTCQTNRNPCLRPRLSRAITVADADRQP